MIILIIKIIIAVHFSAALMCAVITFFINYERTKLVGRS